ncbi:MAG TPA: hypothetical protein VM911_22550 [Pyrinomonadaceae bacterium]|nr:hypothetical protein [Pyrinomonadaceae bacterium]
MFGKTAPFIFALLLLLSASAQTARAQEQTSGAPASSAPTTTAQQQPASQQRSASEAADLSITANVTARELRFEVVPDPKVEFPGKPERNTSWETERQNLPRPVQPGVTYRDIGIQLKITSVFADIDRIVAEALGEVPVTDDTTPQPTQPAPAPTQQETAPTTPSTAPPTSQPPSEGKP